MRDVNTHQTKTYISNHKHAMETASPTPGRGETTRFVRLAEPSAFFDAAIQTPHFNISFRPVLLGDIPDIQTQQAAITKDLLFALLGYEGCYVRYSDRYNPSSLHDRIHGPDYKIAKHLDVSLKAVTKKLLRYGRYYAGLKAFAQIYDGPVFGKVNQRLCLEIKKFLSQYQKLVISLQDSFDYNGTFSLNSLDSELSRFFADKLVHLYEIVLTIHTETEERNPRIRTSTSANDIGANLAGDPNFNTFLQSIRNDIELVGPSGLLSDPMRFDVCKSGLVLKIVQNRLDQFKGDQVSFNFLTNIFDSISQDYVATLNLWLATGNIDDPFQEFLIKENDLPKNIFYSNMEKYWDELYVIKIDGLIDQFSSKDIQTKILTTGKYLNIFKQCTGAPDLLSLPESLCSVALPSEIGSLYSQDLNLKIDQFYARANNLLLGLLFKGYQFSELLINLHQTYFLRDSFDIDTFMDKTMTDLGKSKKSASTLKPINTYNELFLSEKLQLQTVDLNDDSAGANTSISGVLNFCEKFSIDASNFYDVAEEIINIKSFDAELAIRDSEKASSAIKRLVSQSLQRRTPVVADSDKLASEKLDDCVIAGVNVDIKLPFPLNLFISENFVFEYQLVFKLQMILKFASKLCDQSWKDIVLSTVWNYKQFTPSIKKLVLRCRVLSFRMKNVLNEIQNHINYSIIESNFSTLTSVIKKFENSLNTSKQTPLASRESNIHMKHHGLKHNNIFEEKIMAASHRHISSSNVETDDKHNDAYELNNQIGTYLNNILRDSMITSGPLLECLRALLNDVMHFATTVTRLKKSLILMNAELLSAFQQDFPEKFGSLECNDDLIRTRTELLNDVLTRHWSSFSGSLDALKGALESEASENALFLTLLERLSAV